MSEGIFGWLLGGALGGGHTPSTVRTAEEMARHQHEMMRDVRPTDPSHLALAAGMAAVPQEELKRRMGLAWAREFEARKSASAPPATKESEPRQ